MGKDYDVERGFISRLLADKDMTVVRDNRITPQFLTGDNKNAYKFILECHINTGEVPTVRAFKKKFPRYKLEKDEDGEVGTEENLRYWIKELRAKAKHNTLADATEEAAQLLNEGDADEAEKVMAKSLFKIETEIKETEDINLNENLDERKREYEKRKITQGIVGIPTGLHYMDASLKGLQKEVLTTLIAPTGIGKTYFQILVGAYASLNGYKVLQGLTEMSASQMRDRYEMILFAMTVGGIDANLFKSGKLSPKMEKKYYKFLDEVMPDIDLPMFTAESPMQVEANVDKYNPDLLLIDGAYLMNDDEGAESDWLRIAHITRALKKMSKRRHIHTFINSQADKNTSKKIGPELGDISFSQSIGQDSDNVLGLYRTEQMKSDREICVKILKNREGGGGKVMLDWDFSTMKFLEIYHEEDEWSAEGENSSEEKKEDSYVDL